MTEMTPLAQKLWDASIDAIGNHVDAWNNVAEVAEAELTAPRAVRLPTVEECHQAIADRYEALAAAGGHLTGNYGDWCASVALDLVASLNPTWVEVPPDATIPAGTRVRIEQDINHAIEKTTVRDWHGDHRDRKMRFFVPSGTVFEPPLDPRVEAIARAIHDAGKSEYIWDDEPASVRDNYVRLAKAAKAAIAALGEDI